MTRKGLYILCLALFCVSFLYLLYTNRMKLTDTAFFGGDSWEYQALGVNIAYGHGYQNGAIESFETYQFDPDRKRNQYDDILNPTEPGMPETYFDHFSKGGYYFFQRTPGYPLFLAFAYKIFGVHPMIVKIIQIMFLALAGGLLPWIGAFYWGRLGILTGVLSSISFFLYFCPEPTEIMAEALITFGLLVWVLLLILWEKKPGLLRIYWLGVATAALILIKGSTIFIPAFFVLYLLFKIKKIEKGALSIAIFCLGMISLFAPWSAYATSKSGEFIYLSTSGGEVLLLNSNNEDCIQDGAWHPEWSKWKAGDQSYLYNRLEGTNYSQLRKVWIFFLQNKKDLPRLFLNKISRGFPIHENQCYPILFLSLPLYYFLFLFFAGSKERVPIFPAIYFLNILLITVIFYGDTRLTKPFMLYCALPAVYMFFLPPKIILSAFRRHDTNSSC